MNPNHGLIIGKFLPLHNGHKRLIDHALSRCERLTIAVFSRDAEPISGTVRERWIRSEYPNVRVVRKVANYPDPWDELSWDYWVQLCRQIASEATTLFSGEEYGDELARRMGIAHEIVDRRLMPVSATAIRLDPIRQWDHVPPSVRPYFARKIVLVGAESTGKTTLAAGLADHYQTTWVPEFGREYCERNDINALTPDDLVAIAVEQCTSEDRMAVQSNGLLICDTDLMVTRAWCQHLCGTVHPGIEDLERDRHYDLHLVTNLNVRWVNDGTRVCRDASVRRWFHHRYVEELTRRGALHMALPAREQDAFVLACNIVETLWPALRAP